MLQGPTGSSGGIASETYNARTCDHNRHGIKDLSANLWSRNIA